VIHFVEIDFVFVLLCYFFCLTWYYTIEYISDDKLQICRYIASYNIVHVIQYVL